MGLEGPCEGAQSLGGGAGETLTRKRPAWRGDRGLSRVLKARLDLPAGEVAGNGLGSSGMSPAKTREPESRFPAARGPQRV